MPPGRPSLYTDELATRICERLASGESLRSVCRDENMPHEATVRTWASDTTRDFSTQYARARMAGYAGLADELIDIADDKLGDPQRDRLRLDTRKWLLSKCLPKIYGDKIQHTGGSEGDAPIAVQLIELIGVRPDEAAD